MLSSLTAWKRFRKRLTKSTSICFESRSEPAWKVRTSPFQSASVSEMSTCASSFMSTSARHFNLRVMRGSFFTVDIARPTNDASLPKWRNLASLVLVLLADKTDMVEWRVPRESATRRLTRRSL